MKRQYCIGIDSGSQSSRVMMFDLTGEYVCGAAVKHKPFLHENGGVYMDEVNIWESLCEASRQMMAQFKGDKADILGVGLTPHNGTLFFMRKDGSHVCHPMCYNDYRVAELDPMPDDCPAWEAWQHINSKANVLKTHEPELYKQVDVFASVGGYLGYMLTGKFVDTISNAIGNMPLDRERFCYEDRDWVYDCVGMRRDQLCEGFLPGTAMGNITKEAAELTGMPEGIPLVAGASDKQTEAFGAGAVHDGDAFVTYGTEANLTYVSNTFHSMEKGNFFYSLLAAVPYQWNYAVPMARGYWLITWFKEQFAQDLIRISEETGKGRYGAEDFLTQEALKLPAGSDGLMVMPDFLAPRSRPHSSGTIIGFKPTHTRAHLFRAFIEGIAMTLRLNSENLQKTMPDLKPIEAIYVGGGGSRSDLSMQVTADIFGVPAKRAAYHETGALGAAICAAIGSGAFKDVEDAAPMMSSKSQTFMPNPEAHAFYEEMYNKVFRTVYPTLLSTYETMDDIFKK